MHRWSVLAHERDLVAESEDGYRLYLESFERSCKRELKNEVERGWSNARQRLYRRRLKSA
ncbi:MAG: hypothetical protein AAFR41_07710 [Pseudomonadota bacterium]